MSESCCLSLPDLPLSSLWSPTLHNLSVTDFFCSSHYSYLFFTLLPNKEVPGVLRQKCSVERLAHWSNNVNLNVSPAAAGLHANTLSASGRGVSTCDEESG